MSDITNGFFDGIDKTPVYGKSQYFVPGLYLVEIANTKAVKGRSNDMIIVEATVLAYQGNAEEPPISGSTVSQFISLARDRIESAQRTWKGFCEAVLGSDVKKWSAKEWEINSTKIWDDNTFEGTRQVVEVFLTDTRSGGSFTHHTWKGEPSAADLKLFGLSA